MRKLLVSIPDGTRAAEPAVIGGTLCAGISGAFGHPADRKPAIARLQRHRPEPRPALWIAELHSALLASRWSAQAGLDALPHHRQKGPQPHKRR